MLSYRRLEGFSIKERLKVAPGAVVGFHLNLAEGLPSVTNIDQVTLSAGIMIAGSMLDTQTHARIPAGCSMQKAILATQVMVVILLISCIKIRSDFSSD
jgi:hypothetical protein